jgi:hypothetical protein
MVLGDLRDHGVALSAAEQHYDLQSSFHTFPEWGLL